jgi:hypothetical protein
MRNGAGLAVSNAERQSKIILNYFFLLRYVSQTFLCDTQPGSREHIRQCAL